MIVARFNSVTEFSDELAEDHLVVRRGIVRVTKAYRQRDPVSVHLGMRLSVIATAVVRDNDAAGDFDTLVRFEAPIGDVYQDGVLAKVTAHTEARADEIIKSIERDCKTFGLVTRPGVYEPEEVEQ